MKHAVSNIALTAFDHRHELMELRELGITGVEIAPSRIWHNTWTELKASDVTAYRNDIEIAGLEVVGLHSLFFDHPELGLFKGPETDAQSMLFLEHLSAVCRDLGGKTLIYGGGRKRGDMPLVQAYAQAYAFFSELCTRIENHGTCFCFEPLGPNDTDFINSALESLAIVKDISHPALRVQLDAKALYENNEAVSVIFQAVSDELVHFHANEPGLNTLGHSGVIDHQFLGQMLRDINYDEYISIEQRMLNDDNPLADIKVSIAVLKENYV
jgi:sugar phosphate isomerase/epimerase